MSGEVSPVQGGEPGKISWPGPGVCQGWWTVGERRGESLIDLNTVTADLVEEEDEKS